MIVVTAASGQLGRLVVQELLKSVPASQIIAGVRSPEKAKDLASTGVQVRELDYTKPQTIQAALAGVKKLLLISSNAVGSRAAEHKNVIDAAKKVGVELIAYTSILHADTTPMILAQEHKETEAMIKASGLPYVFLRNGWYTENYTANIAPVLQHGAVLGSAKDGKFSLAARADYAAAAAKVLTLDNQAGKIYELAGDVAYTLADYAAEIAKQTGKTIVYSDMPESDYAKVLVSVGLPEGFASVLADCDTGASKGALFDDSKTLSKLIGRATTPIAESIKAVL